MSGLDTAGLDWEALRDLRQGFLHGMDADYWLSSELIDQYDRTFGERIGWKWDHVLSDLRMLGWAPPSGPVVDWACGSGVAGRRFGAAFGGDRPLYLRDRSALAVRYAARRAREAGLEVLEGATAGGVLLVSHVLNELDDSALDGLVALANRMDAVVWVEPGDRATSRRLSTVRSRIDLSPVAPCTHSGACPMLEPDHERHWCHQFGAPPPEAFTDRGWGEFANKIGVDLRSLPLSYLVLDARCDTGSGSRIIGKPKVYKAHATVLLCDETGLKEVRVGKGRLPSAFRAARKDQLGSRVDCVVRDDEVLEWNDGGPVL